VAPPKQQRSQETLERLLDAGQALIEEKGLADVSVPDIVQRAGSSVGGFYARFRDKAELLRALEERFFAELGARVDEISRAEHWGQAPIPAIVRLCMGELVETFREREALIRAFMARAAQDAVFMEEAHRFRCKVSDGIVRLLLTRRRAIGHADPGLAIDFGVQLAFGMMHHWVIFGGVQAGGRRLSDRDLVDELSRSFLGYLAYAPLEEPS
jgi:AcrR family transcriptional regulator